MPLGLICSYRFKYLFDLCLRFVYSVDFHGELTEIRQVEQKKSDKNMVQELFIAMARVGWRKRISLGMRS
jgi:hypothetical protein